MRKLWAAPGRAVPPEPVPVCWWPAPLAPGASLVVIGIAGDGGRDAARLRIRQALREALAQWSGQPLENVVLRAEPGRAPAVSVRAAAPSPGIAISHDGALSLAAIKHAGAVGIDVMRVQAVADWHTVAHDYLGPEVAAALAALGPAQRAAAFARAWTEHEARLKCHGLQLVEWSPRLQRRLAECRGAPLALPDGHAGTVAWLP